MTGGLFPYARRFVVNADKMELCGRNICIIHFNTEPWELNVKIIGKRLENQVRNVASLLALLLIDAQAMRSKNEATGVK